MKKRIILALTSLLVVTAACSPVAEEGGAAEERTTPVKVALVEAGDLEATYEVSGQLHASLEIAMIPKVSGELSELSVKKGDRVESGQVLAKLDDRELRQAYEGELASLEQARMQLDSALVTKSKAEQGLNNARIGLEQANLNLRKSDEGEATSGSTGAEGESQGAIDNSTIQRKQLELQYEEAKKNLERMKTLYESGDISLQQYESAVSAEQNAMLSLQQAEISTQNYIQTREQAEIGVSNAEQDIVQAEIGVRQAQSSIGQAELRVEQAKQRLDDAVIVSKHAGEIVAIEAQPGELVGTQSPLFTLVSLDPVLLKATVSAKQLPLFESGMEVGVEVPVLGDGGVTTTGTVSFVSPVTDASGLYPIEVEIENTDRQFKPGMVAAIQLPEVLVDGTLIVPTEAVVEEAGRSYVYVVEDGRAVQKDVSVVAAQTEQSAVEGDLAAGDTVVVKGQITLSDGHLVTIVEDGESK